MDEEIERLVIGVRADTAGFARDVADMRAALDGPLAAGAERAGRAIEAGLLRAVRTGKLGFEDLRRMAVSVLAEIAEAAVRGGIGSILGRGQSDRGGDRGGHGGLLRGLTGLIGGLAGRATGGPVAPGVAYLVGERGPELFVPTASGRVEPDRIVAGHAPADAERVTREMRSERETVVRQTVATPGRPIERPSGAPPLLSPAQAVAPLPPAPLPPAPLPVVREVRVAITINAPRGEAPAVLAKSGRQVARAVRSALGRVD